MPAAEILSFGNVKCTCRQCDREFFRTPSVVARGQGKYCSKVCRLAAQGGGPASQECRWCGKIFASTITRVKNGSKYCSIACVRASHVVTITTCIWCGNEFKAHDYRLAEGNDKYCSRGCCNAHRATGIYKGPRIGASCQMCGKISYWQPYWASRRKFCSRRCTSIYAITQIRSEGTSIERVLEEILISEDIAYESQKPLLNVTVADFFVAPNLVIFADGDYWHALPHVRERDARSNDLLSAHSYQVIRFLGSEIESDTAGVRKRLVEFVETGDFYYAGNVAKSAEAHVHGAPVSNR